MDSLIFRALMLLNSPQDSGEEVQVGSSHITINIDHAGFEEDIIRVEGREQPQMSNKPTVQLFKSFNKLKSSPEQADDSATGFRGATFQWRGADPKPWCILEAYHFFDPTYSKQRISRAIRYARNELAELAGRSRPLWTRTVRRLRLESELDGMLRASIACETYAAKVVASETRQNSLSPLASTERFVTEFRQLGELYRAQRTRRNLEQIFMLQLHHANLNLFSDFLQRFATDYAAPRMVMFDPQQAELRRWNLKAIVTDSRLYRQFTSLGAELTATTESLLDLVLALEDNTKENGSSLAVLGAEIRGCNKDITMRLSRMSGDLDHHLQLLNLSRDMNQSGNVQVLTLLATIFLPLSLSAGVLSMQSRFKDLGDLLYDFFGVVVLLAAVVALLLVAMFVLSSAREMESRLWRYRLYKVYLRPILLATMAAIDVVLGAKILGYGIVAAIGAPVVITVVVLVVRWISGLMGQAVDKVPRWQIGRQKDNKNDIEGDLGCEPKGKEAAVSRSNDPGVKIQAELLGSNGQDTRA
ncbi:hypothetical protein NM208_g1048 [Fusarium decemcellulare]|uniref:Uncharacterized protein n=1 Tax=Fusarium decemcellulare TaxID=57161 RepID=A0ACC1SXH5_9HYPO|nr:hypothetical protein NM208_g1048 [Fusarium decemcellulare]